MEDMSQIVVHKKDGRLEPFMREKVVNGMVKAGATQEQANNIADQIERWILETAQKRVVETLDIRAKLLELLRPINPQAATSFESYVKPTSMPGQTTTPVPNQPQGQLTPPENITNIPPSQTGPQAAPQTPPIMPTPPLPPQPMQ
uniref:ATP-cone domain-containing protein n=1 Tax=candidate division CPR3 bacterium TaxID=2268181 RepID=A0A7C5YRX4_UNCC3